MDLNKLLLTSTAAVALGVTAAAADSNNAYTSQSGTNNAALLQQTGANNTVGRGSDPATQSGTANDLDIIQSGDNNAIGAGEQGLNQDALGVGIAASADTNIANIEQSSNFNRVVSVQQRYSGTTAPANNLNILQTGGDNNTVKYAWQLGVGNTTTIEQSGTNNGVDTFQYGTGPTGSSNGTGNTISVNISGDNNNGSNALTGDYSGSRTSLSAGGPPWSVGLRAATVTQRGNDNDASIDISGNDTAFGINQKGNSNDALGVVITGDENSFSSDQFGNFNTISLSTVSGFDNSIGFVQEGNSNMAMANVGGDFNRARLKQTGNFNDTELWVDGNTNTAALDVTGDSNVLYGQQRFGDNNTMTVNLYGDNNNNAGYNFSGDALSARDDANNATSLVFGKGRLWQHGSNNAITLDVGSVGGDSDNNLFAVLQQGSDNAVNGSISGLGNNQAAVAQLGSNNATTFSQMGSFNNLGVTQ